MCICALTKLHLLLSRIWGHRTSSRKCSSIVNSNKRPRKPLPITGEHGKQPDETLVERCEKIGLLTSRQPQIVLGGPMNDNRRQRAAASSPTSVRRAAYDEEDFLEVSRLTSSKVRTLWVCEYSQLLQGAPCAQSSAGGWFFPMDLQDGLGRCSQRGGGRV